MHKLPTIRPADADLDAILRDKMAEIEALIAAIEAGAVDCDLKLAALLENESERVRVAIIEKLREMLRAHAEEKEKELDKILEREQRQEIERKRGMFMQWLQWMMSEETIRKMRESFLASPMMERYVRGLGRHMASKGMDNIQLGHKADLGSLTQQVPDARQKGREKGAGRE